MNNRAKIITPSETLFLKNYATQNNELWEPIILALLIIMSLWDVRCGAMGIEFQSNSLHALKRKCPRERYKSVSFFF